MKILFYVQPIIEGGNPLSRKHWLDVFCSGLINAFLSKNEKEQNYEIYIVLGEHLDEYFNENRVKKVVLKRRELLEPFSSGLGNTAISAWMNGSFSSEQMSHYENILKRELGEFEPDVIFYSGWCPYLAHTFPNALRLCQEYSLFSRNPYPPVLYLDPIGMMGNNYLEKYGQVIKKRDINEEQRRRIERFKDKCHHMIKQSNPFQEIMKKYEGRYSKMVMVPLNANTFPYQFDYLHKVMDSVSADTGVVVTTHPDNSNLNYRGMDYLTNHFSNLIWDREFEDYYSQSQYLVPYVDAIITDGLTSVAYQALIWDKVLICLRPVQRAIADGVLLGNVEKVIEKGIGVGRQRARDNTLHWMLTRYSTPAGYLFHPDWITMFIERSLDKFRNKGIDEDFYEEIDREDVIFSNLEAAIEVGAPQQTTRANYSYDRLQELCGDYEARINGFTELMKKMGTGIENMAQMMDLVGKEDVSAKMLLKAGLTLKGFGMNQNAILFMEKAVEKDPFNEDARLSLGEICRETGRT